MTPSPAPSLRLTRRVRFSVALGAGRAPFDPAQPRSNAYAGWPSTDLLALPVDLEVACTGRADPESGYLVSIAEIDAAVRDVAIPRFADASRAAVPPHPAILLQALMPDLQRALAGRLDRVTLHATPQFSLTLEASVMTHVLLCQHFDFAAAHRLSVATWSDAENARVFGRCRGDHGHNYRVGVAVSVPVDAIARGEGLSLPRIEAIVHDRLLRVLDHRHLNRDVAAFENVVPSVENIARVCHDLLRNAIGDAGGTLTFVRVWETEKTSAMYPAASTQG